MVTPRHKVHPTDEMTSRQRLLAAYSGQEADRLAYWAKVTNQTWRSGQPEKVRRLSDRELLDYILADGIFHAPAAVTVTRPHVSREATHSDNVQTRVTHTPDGDLVEKWANDPYTGSWHPVEFPIKTRRDIEKFRWLCTDVEVEPDAEQIEKGQRLRKEIGERGILKTAWGTSPLMDLVEHIIGPINTSLMLFDYPDEINELIELMHRACLARAGAVARCTAADVVASVENTSTTLISPQQFEKYCYTHLCDYGRAIEVEGKMHELHMCGHTRALLPKIDKIPAASIEAFTSPTLGNTRLTDGRTQAPSKTLVGGTNVNVWLWPVEKIKRYIIDELAACPDNRHIILTTAGVAPPGCPAEKFHEIGDWIYTLPAGL
ncbi:MAG: uroporphyrinogen decarboxylase family protein [Planctomycetota bacterium]|jgi:uroporphyrinogen-III decarboxylase